MFVTILFEILTYLSILFDEGPPPSRVDFVTTVGAEFDPEKILLCKIQSPFFLTIIIDKIQLKNINLLHDDSTPEKEKTDLSLK